MTDSIELKSFDQFAKPPTRTVIVSYTFMDGTIPISETDTVSYQDFNASKFGIHVALDSGAQGPVIYIDTPYADETEIYVIRFTPEFMNDQENFNRYLILLRNPA